MKLIWIIFWAMIAVFAIIIATIFGGVYLAENFPLVFVILPAGAISLGLSVTLIVLTVKRKIEGKLYKFLLLTGASAAGLPVFAVLHNLVTALCVSLFGLGPDFDEPVFFILATLVCPLGFLVGAVGTIILGLKKEPGADRAIEGGKP